MISQCGEDRVGLEIEMLRVPPISIDDIPQVLLCKSGAAAAPGGGGECRRRRDVGVKAA